MKNLWYTTKKKLFSGDFNASRVIVFDASEFKIPQNENEKNEFSFKLNAGSNDDVFVRASDDMTEIYILSVNTSLLYFGLEIYVSRNNKPFELESEFFSQESDTYETLGEDWEEYSLQEILEQLVKVVC